MRGAMIVAPEKAFAFHCFPAARRDDQSAFLPALQLGLWRMLLACTEPEALVLQMRDLCMSAGHALLQAMQVQIHPFRMEEFLQTASPRRLRQRQRQHNGLDYIRRLPAHHAMPDR